jgi:hypothetical protein
MGGSGSELDLSVSLGMAEKETATLNDGKKGLKITLKRRDLEVATVCSSGRFGTDGGFSATTRRWT